MANSNPTARELLTATRRRPDPNRYLIQRRRVYYFQRQVPLRHRVDLGFTNFTRSLGTSDLRTARQRRDRLNIEFEAMLASLAPAVDAWSPRGVIQTAHYVRLNGSPEQFEQHVTSIAEQQPARNIVDPSLVEAVTAGAAIVADAGAGALLSEATGEHLEALAKTARPNSVSARRRALESLQAHLGDVPVAGITRRELAQWVGSFPDSESHKTKSNRAGDIVAFLRWVVDAGLRDESPATGLRTLLKQSSRGTEETKVRPWTPAEVRELLNKMRIELDSDDPLQHLVRLALYTGCRREELAQLRGRDIEVIDGVQVLRIREGKSKAAVRMIPVHSAIAHLVADIAPDDYVLAMDGSETADGRRSHTTGSRFSALKRAWGFPAALTFHGFRRAAAQRMESAGVERHIAETILGHARQSLSFGLYSNGADLAVLLDAVEAINYGVEGSA